ncbi:MAG: hypothetical protein ACRD2D_09320 [Terriglobales bacterium]
MRFHNLKSPPFKTALAELEVEGTRLDLHAKLQLVGLTYGIAPASVTLGWAARSETLVIRGGRALPVIGLALHFHGVRRFEVAIPESEPGDLEYFELRRDAQPGGGAQGVPAARRARAAEGRSAEVDEETAFIFFFEKGTVRVSAEECHAELVMEGEDDTSGLVQ